MIELGVIKFEDGASDRVYRVLQTFNQLQQPSAPILRLTGIKDADVEGQRNDDVAVHAIADDAAVAIAYDASFDRQVCERRRHNFAEKNSTCSCHQLS